MQGRNGSTPTNSSLIIQPLNLDHYSLVVWKVSYTTLPMALAGELDSVFGNFTINSSRVIIERKVDIRAFMRSGIQNNTFHQFFSGRGNPVFIHNLSCNLQLHVL